MKKFMLVAVSSIPLILSACGPYGPMRRWDGANGYWCGLGYGPGGMFMGIVVLAALIVAIYFIVRAIQTKNNVGTLNEGPLDILKKRYARGEITKEEFENIKKDL